MIRVIAQIIGRNCSTRTNNAVTSGLTQHSNKMTYEMNSVKLMGSIEHNIKRLSNGSLKFFLKTVNDDTSYSIHNVTVANKNLLSMVNGLAVNQRVYVAGRMKSEMILIEGRRHINVEVMTSEMYKLLPNPQMDDVSNTDALPSQMDQNQVEMMAFICSEVYKTHNYISFSIVTHFTKQKGRNDESVEREYHRVNIHNDLRMLRIAGNLNRSDRIYVTGCINYNTKVYHDCSEKSNGYIQPTNLVKLANPYLK